MVITIKEKREAAELTQAELAEKIGVDTSTVCLWESGKREPKFTSVMRMAKVFSCSPDQLVDVD